MSKSKRILAVLGVIVLVVSGYGGWRVYQGKQMTKQSMTDTQKLAKGTGSGSASSAFQVPGSNGTTPVVSSDPVSPSSPSSTPSSGEYKQLMAKTYQQMLDTMQNLKSCTLALQAHTISFSDYKASTLQAQATFASAEAFVRANPPRDESLKASYQEFLAGISLAKDSMDVLLKGISSFNPSKFYEARDMGVKAQQQVINAYAHF